MDSLRLGSGEFLNSTGSNASNHSDCFSLNEKENPMDCINKTNFLLDSQIPLKNHTREENPVLNSCVLPMSIPQLPQEKSNVFLKNQETQVGNNFNNKFPANYNNRQLSEIRQPRVFNLLQKIKSKKPTCDNDYNLTCKIIEKEHKLLLTEEDRESFCPSARLKSNKSDNVLVPVTSLKGKKLENRPKSSSMTRSRSFDDRSSIMERNSNISTPKTSKLKKIVPDLKSPMLKSSSRLDNHQLSTNNRLQSLSSQNLRNIESDDANFFQNKNSTSELRGYSALSSISNRINMERNQIENQKDESRRSVCINSSNLNLNRHNQTLSSASSKNSIGDDILDYSDEEDISKHEVNKDIELPVQNRIENAENYDLLSESIREDECLDDNDVITSTPRFENNLFNQEINNFSQSNLNIDNSKIQTENSSIGENTDTKPSLTVKQKNKKKSMNPPPSYIRGQLPKYLVARKAEEQRRLEAEEQFDPECPPNHTPLPDHERRNTLHLLKKSQADIMREMSMLPVAQDTLRVRKLYQELEGKLNQIEEGLKIFSQPKVYVINDE